MQTKFVQKFMLLWLMLARILEGSFLSSSNRHELNRSERQLEEGKIFTFDAVILFLKTIQKDIGAVFKNQNLNNIQISISSLKEGDFGTKKIEKGALNPASEDGGNIITDDAEFTTLTNAEGLELGDQDSQKITKLILISIKDNISGNNPANGIYSVLGIEFETHKCPAGKNDDFDCSINLRVFDDLNESSLSIKKGKKLIVPIKNLIVKTAMRFMAKRNQRFFTSQNMNSALETTIKEMLNGDSAASPLYQDGKLSSLLSGVGSSLGELQNSYDTIRKELKFYVSEDKQAVKDDFSSRGQLPAEENHDDRDRDQIVDNLDLNKSFNIIISPNFKDMSNIGISAEMIDHEVKIVYTLDFYSITDTFSSTTIPFLAKLVEQRINQIINDILVPVSMIEHFNRKKSPGNTAQQSGDKPKPISDDTPSGPGSLENVSNTFIVALNKQTKKTTGFVFKKTKPGDKQVDNATLHFSQNKNVLSIGTFFKSGAGYYKAYPLDSSFNALVLVLKYADYLSRLTNYSYQLDESRTHGALTYKYSAPLFVHSCDHSSVNYLDDGIFAVEDNLNKPRAIMSPLEFHVVRSKKNTGDVSESVEHFITFSCGPLTKDESKDNESSQVALNQNSDANLISGSVLNQTRRLKVGQKTNLASEVDENSPRVRLLQFDVKDDKGAFISQIII